ncbi:hypothetical protein HLH14_11255 [Acinetobacter sp. ANC 4282]|uniref:hypothetical protein n=1 Tax=Acinetobacter terrae TaxID=2731247 RepID=UPI000A3376D6|nr:hypothetical protein [Acinetobacter terrae]NNH16551.1 hypothetical protein [Acinetobacter terrae]OTG75863.1 hypothetical protein B9T23_09135 [Acinetobacter terrae]
MKKRLLASLCFAAMALTACDKKPNEAPASSSTSPAATPPASTQPATAALSSNNAADIKNDLKQIETLSNSRAKEASALQNKANEAAQKSDKASLNAIVADMKTYIARFNQDLDALKLKSSELDAVRDKIKESNNIGIELSEASIANTPDSKKITELQNRATKLQKELVTEMQALQTKAKTAP